MLIGKLTHRIEYQEAVGVQDSTGQEIRTWVNFAWGWAEIKEVSARQQTGADITKVQNNYTLTARYTPGISALMRVRAGTRFFDIKHVRNYMQANEYYILTCTEITT